MTYQPSLQMREVLRQAAERGGEIAVRALVLLRVQRGDEKAVVQASLSRTLRRMWRRGLVELWSDWHQSASDLQGRNREIAERVSADPEGEYTSFRKWLAGLAAATGGAVQDRYGSAAAFAKAKVEAANGVPILRTTRVVLTEEGWETVNSLSGSGVNRAELEARARAEKERRFAALARIRGEV